MLTIVAPLLLAAVPPGPVGDRPAIELPENPDTVVISFSYEGGFTLPPKNQLPYLTVTAGGTVTVNDRFTDDQARAHIKPEQVQELLKFIIRENDFLAFDPEKVEQAARAAAERQGDFPAIADAATTRLLVRTAEKEHEASYYALGFHAGMFEGVKPLQQFSAIEERLNRLRNVVWAGGEEAVARYVEMANAELKEKFPDAKPLTVADLQYAGRREGTLTLNFHRDGEKPGTYVSAEIRQPQGGEAEVTVSANPG